MDATRRVRHGALRKEKASPEQRRENGQARAPFAAGAASTFEHVDSKQL
jgi:hypothetical protein